jgi:hypothetical protein
MQFSTRLLKRSEPNHEGSRIECRRLVPSVADVAMKQCLHVPSMRHVLRADSDSFHKSRNPNSWTSLCWSIAVLQFITFPVAGSLPSLGVLDVPVSKVVVWMASKELAMKRVRAQRRCAVW